MYCIVPLAGPDFYNERYGYKPLCEIEGKPLLEVALMSRCWYKNGEVTNDKIIFVIRDNQMYDKFEIYLKENFCGSKVVKISDYTKGALLSAMAGASLINDFTEPIVVDLIDILYEGDFSPTKIFESDINIGGILPYFNSCNEKYSYLEIVNGYVTQTVEKKVISNDASAGTYFFKNLNVFLEAVSGSVKFDKIISYNNNLFLCPSYNFIKKKYIFPQIVNIKNELSLTFHN